MAVADHRKATEAMLRMRDLLLDSDEPVAGDVKMSLTCAGIAMQRRVLMADDTVPAVQAQIATTMALLFVLVVLCNGNPPRPSGAGSSDDGCMDCDLEDDQEERDDSIAIAAWESTSIMSEIAAADGAAADGEGEEAALKQATTAAGAVLAALPLLTRLGSHLHRRPLLLARMCRLCRAALEAAPTDDRLSDAVDGCIDAALLPALTLSTPNPGLVHELWLLLEVRPYTSRYRSYGVLHARMKDEAWPELYACRAKTADDTKRMMRRLSKENTKQYGRHLGKLRVRVRVGLDPPR